VAGASNASLGLWSTMSESIPIRRDAPYAVPAALAAECVSAASYAGLNDQYTPFTTSAQATTAMIGRWLRCRDDADPAYAGIEIGGDGTWRDLMWEDGALVARGGLDHEGIVEAPVDTSVVNNRVGLFQIGIRGRTRARSGHLWGDKMIFFPYDSTQSAVFVRTNRVPTVASNPFAPRERAGAAGCAVAEEMLTDLPANQTNATLAGRWTLCSGDLLEAETALDFDGQGGVRFLDAASGVLRMGSYQPVNPATIPSTYLYTTLIFDDLQTWTIVLSQKPLKLWMVTPASSRVARHAIFSAAPTDGSGH